MLVSPLNSATDSAVGVRCAYYYDTIHSEALRLRNSLFKIQEMFRPRIQYNNTQYTLEL